MRALVFTLIALGALATEAGGQSARVSAQVQWSIKGKRTNVTPNSTPGIARHPSTREELTVNTDGEQSFETGADVTLQWEMDPNNLPGGMVTRVSHTGQLILGFQAGNLLAQPSRLIALNGTLSARNTVVQPTRCEPLRKGELGMGSTSVNQEIAGAAKFDASNAAIQLLFQGDKPTHFSAGARGLKLKGVARFGCGGTEPVEREAEFLWDLPADPQKAGWVMSTTKTVDGYVVTASWRGEQDGYTVEKFGKLTWSQPKAPAGPPVNQKAMAMPETGGSGSMSFTQGGKDVTWKLAQVQEQGGMGMTAKVLLYTPNGQPPSDDTSGLMTVTVMNMQGSWSLISLNVSNGPAGDSEYDSSSNKCAVKVTPSPLAVSGTCSGGFNGPAITKFSLTANK